MNRRRFLFLALGWPATGFSQPSARLVRIGFLSAGSFGSLAKRIDAMREGFRQLGYVEGQGLLIEYQFAEGMNERLPELAKELLRRKVDVLVTAGPTGTRAASEATATVPIVMTFDTDPVASKFAASLARPGRNITGLSIISPELSAKQVELLKEVMPKLSRIAVAGDSREPADARTIAATERAAKALNIGVQKLNVPDFRGPPELLEAAGRDGAQALILLPMSTTSKVRRQLASEAVRHRLPAMYPYPEFVEDGGLMTYSVNLEDLYRRAAAYVDKILKGAKPAELPIEQPKKFDLVINVKAAKQIDLRIPTSVLTRADRLIE